jgi:hypothetical protein
MWCWVDRDGSRHVVPRCAFVRFAGMWAPLWLALLSAACNGAPVISIATLFGPSDWLEGCGKCGVPQSQCATGLERVLAEARYPNISVTALEEEERSWWREKLSQVDHGLQVYGDTVVYQTSWKLMTDVAKRAGLPTCVQEPQGAQESLFKSAAQQRHSLSPEQASLKFAVPLNTFVRSDVKLYRLQRFGNRALKSMTRTEWPGMPDLENAFYHLTPNPQAESVWGNMRIQRSTNGKQGRDAQSHGQGDADLAGRFWTSACQELYLMAYAANPRRRLAPRSSGFEHIAHADVLPIVLSPSSGAVFVLSCATVRSGTRSLCPGSGPSESPTFVHCAVGRILHRRAFGTERVGSHRRSHSIV